MMISKASSSNEPLSEEAISDLYIRMCDEYEHVFMDSFGESGIFIFKSLGRKDYKEIIESDVIDNLQKEEVICETCVLYPKDFDFENCEEAGLPTMLAQAILEKSLLKEPKALKNLIHFYRNELSTDIDKQVSCVIHEAFPEYTMEEIENWDIIRTAQFMTQAEFILHSLRGVPIAPMDDQEDQPSPSRMPVAETEEVGENPQKKPTLSREKIEELKRIAPNVDWEQDFGKLGQDGLRHQNVDARRMSERPLDGSEEGQNAIPEALQDRFKVVNSEG